MNNPLLRLLCTTSLLAITGASIAQWTPPPPPPPPPQPDLVVQSLGAGSASAPRFFVGEPINVTFYMKNIGAAGAPGPNLKLALPSGSVIQSASTNPSLLCSGDTCSPGSAPPVPPGASILANFTFTYPQVGNVSFEARADPQGRSQESSESNNNQGKSITVAHRPKIQVDVLCPGKAPSGGQSTVAYVGQTFVMGVKLTNIGQVDAVPMLDGVFLFPSTFKVVGTTGGLSDVIVSEFGYSFNFNKGTTIPPGGSKTGHVSVISSVKGEISIVGDIRNTVPYENSTGDNRKSCSFNVI